MKGKVGMKRKKQKYFYAYSRYARKVVRVKTEKDACAIADEGNPEYLHICEKCGCILPVN